MATVEGAGYVGVRHAGKAGMHAIIDSSLLVFFDEALMQKASCMIDLQSLLPRDKYDLDSIPLIVKAGYPAIAPILDELLDWTADGNWPVARPLADFFVTLGPPLIDPISQVLQGTDGTQKWHCINLIVQRLPTDILRGLEKDLRRLADYPSDDDRREEVDVEAREILLRLEPVQT
ncbi:DUF5071 domain-containing protein [Mesorhizobium japonicum]|uniref:DUF5071 domain-containing protein n=1 Tax=Mesorhizobium japonicum TaxID=2066070 RepID=UPI001FCE493E|nr:DUF5071 domain-containing protein [Mesorhizobium japonicum]